MRIQKNKKLLIAELMAWSLCIPMHTGEELPSYGDTTLPEQQTSSLSNVPDAPVPTSWTIPPQQVRESSRFRGNWFKKRELVQDARTLYEDFHKNIITTWDAQFQQFEKQYTDVPATLAKRIADLGFDRNDIEQVSAQVNTPPVAPVVVKADKKADKDAKLEVKKPQPLVRSAEDLEMVNKKINEVKEAYTALENLQKSLEQAVKNARQQIPKGLEQEKRLWKLYEEIDAAYDDKRALYSFEEMKTSREYIEQTLSYLQQQLVPYCQQTVARFNEQIERIQSLVSALETERVFVRPQKVMPEKKELPAPVASSWWVRIGDWISFPFRWVWRSGKSLIGR